MMVWVGIFLSNKLFPSDIWEQMVNNIKIKIETAIEFKELLLIFVEDYHEYIEST